MTLDDINMELADLATLLDHAEGIAVQIDRRDMAAEDRAELDTLSALVRLLREKSNSLAVKFEASMPTLRTGGAN